MNRIDRRNQNPDELSPFQLDVEVQLKADVGHTCPEGRENNLTAKISNFLLESGEGAVVLDRDLQGCQFWNTEDLELSDRAKLDALLEVVAAQQAWIDAVPQDTQLPDMPGYDRDWSDSVVELCKA